MEKISLYIKESIFLSLSLFFLITNNFKLASLFLLIANILFLYSLIKINKNEINIFMVFFLFYMLYSLSGPISINFLSGINASFTGPFYQKTYLLINIIIIYLFILQFMISKKKKNIIIEEIEFTRFEIYITLILSFVFELINVYRIGGISKFFIGKAQYQSLVSSIGFVLPSFTIFIYAYIMFLITKLSSSNKLSFKDNILFIIFSIPVLFSKVVLGSRGPLIQITIISVSILSYFRKINFKLKTVLISSILLSLFMVMFTYTGRNSFSEAIREKDISLYINNVFTKENYDSAFNLGKNEFGFTYGNYNEFIKKYNNSHERENTFLEGFLVATPSFLLENEKPTQIVYRFRDEFFPSRAAYGRVSSTGFSALLEGHINFGYLGSIVYYFILGSLFLGLENLLKSGKYKTLFYFAFIIAAQRIHRISFGDFLGIIVQHIYPLIVIIIYTKAIRRISKIDSVT